MKQYVGIDWGEKGWIAVRLWEKGFAVDAFPEIGGILDICRPTDAIAVDIPIGLPEDAGQAALRPDGELRKRLGARAGSVFQTPFRQIARAETVEQAWALNASLGAKMTPMSIRGIRGIVNGVDLFLQAHPVWKNHLWESHPEYCFALLGGDAPPRHRKTTLGGQLERLELLTIYEPNTASIIMCGIKKYPNLKKLDDLLDALCLAVAARMWDRLGMSTIPAAPAMDSTGLYMCIAYPARVEPAAPPIAPERNRCNLCE